MVFKYRCFQKGGGLYKDQYVQVTEITKLADEDGELKVNVDFLRRTILCS